MIVYIKSKEEIEGFREAGKIAGKILNSILQEIKPKITTEYLNEVAIEECKKNNVKPIFLGYKGFPAAICTSVNNVLVHGIPNKRELQDEDIISIDLGIDIDGFIGDTAETTSVGKMTLLSEESQQQEYCSNLINTTRRALQAGIKKAIAGNHLYQISENIYNVIKQNGYSTPVEYGGHGINRYNLHAHPFVPNILNTVDVVLRPGMILAIEPMVINGSEKTKVLEDGWSVEVNGTSAHCEHTILITDGMPEVLTRRD